jgi:hypothetical protein
LFRWKYTDRRHSFRHVEDADDSTFDCRHTSLAARHSAARSTLSNADPVMAQQRDVLAALALAVYLEPGGLWPTRSADTVDRVSTRSASNPWMVRTRAPLFEASEQMSAPMEWA